ncbi:MAG: hypothetical protein D6736_01345 [Nitrospinota bacterium]|nr:MAG: hypothetical protein D6736_01345 [Nitrospinota bacterium]
MGQSKRLLWGVCILGFLFFLGLAGCGNPEKGKPPGVQVKLTNQKVTPATTVAQEVLEGEDGDGGGDPGEAEGEVSGEADDGTPTSPIANAICRFLDTRGRLRGQTTADAKGRYSMRVKLDEDGKNIVGHVECHPPDFPNLIISTFISTFPDVASRRDELLQLIETGEDPELALLADVATSLYNLEKDNALDVNFFDALADLFEDGDLDSSALEPIASDMENEVAQASERWGTGLSLALSKWLPAQIQRIEYVEFPGTANENVLTLAQRQSGELRAIEGVEISDLTGLVRVVFNAPVTLESLEQGNFALSITEEETGITVALGNIGMESTLDTFFVTSVSEDGLTLNLQIRPQDETPQDLARDNETGLVGQDVFTYTVDLDVETGVRDAAGRSLDTTRNDVTVQFTTAIGAACSQQPSTGCPVPE